MRARQSFTPELKAEVVALVRRSNRNIPQVSKDMDLVESVVRHWVTQADVDEGRRPRYDECRARRDHGFT